METQRNAWTVKLKAVQEEKQVPVMMMITSMIMVKMVIMERESVGYYSMLNKIESKLLKKLGKKQAELDKRESQWSIVQC